jgi:glycine/D-amino acid oxidase-like deaminating enzyme
MKKIPYWTDNTPRPDELPTTGPPADVDVAVVGSGLTGLNAAIAIAKAGLSVAVFEKENIGWGASSRNGGFMVPGLFLHVDQLEKRYGKDKTKAFYTWSMKSVDHVVDLVETEGIDCDLVLPGSLVLATKQSHYPGLVGYHEYLRDEYDEGNTEILQPENVRAEIGSPIFHGGIIHKKGAGLDPAKYVYGLAQVASKHGAQLYEHAEVKQIRRENGRFSLSTTKGKLKTRNVLIATNGYTNSMLPRIRFGIFSAACYSIVTEPLSPELQKELSPEGKIFSDSKYYINYFRLLADGRILIGGRNTLVKGHDLDHSARELQSRLVEIFPQLEGVRVTHSWTGNLGFTFDQMPHIGEVDGVHYAYGFIGHGVAIGSLLGYEAGQIIAGERETSLFKEIKHPRYFFSVFDWLFFPFLCAWYRLMDRIK